jgi:hypothetical protein
MAPPLELTEKDMKERHEKDMKISDRNRLLPELEKARINIDSLNISTKCIKPLM